MPSDKVTGATGSRLLPILSVKVLAISAGLAGLSATTLIGAIAYDYMRGGTPNLVVVSLAVLFLSALQVLGISLLVKVARGVSRSSANIARNRRKVEALSRILAKRADQNLQAVSQVATTTVSLGNAIEEDNALTRGHTSEIARNVEDALLAASAEEQRQLLAEQQAELVRLREYVGEVAGSLQSNIPEATGIRIENRWSQSKEETLESLNLMWDKQLEGAHAAWQKGLHSEMGTAVARLGNGADSLATKLYRDLESLAAVLGTIKPSQPLPSLTDWAIAPAAARNLLEIVNRERPSVVLECGSGVSTVLMAYALQAMPGGHGLVSLEHDPDYAARTKDLLAFHGLADHASVVTAPLTTYQIDGLEYDWYSLDDTALPRGIDLLFVDGPPARTGDQARYPAVPLLWDRLATPCTVVLDDAQRDDEHRTVDRWAAEHTAFTVTRLHEGRGTAVLRRASDAWAPEVGTAKEQ